MEKTGAMPSPSVKSGRVVDSIVAIALGLLLFAAIELWAQPVPPPKAHPTDPTVLEQWKAYAEALKRDRDQLELDLATQRARADKTRALWENALKEIERLKAPKADPDAQ